jgi:hypothetical protein
MIDLVGSWRAGVRVREPGEVPRADFAPIGYFAVTAWAFWASWSKRCTNWSGAM